MRGSDKDFRRLYRKTGHSIYRHQQDMKKKETDRTDGEALPLSVAFRLRLVCCILVFAVFAGMDGRGIPSSACDFIYRKLEEPMTKETLCAWAQDIKEGYRKLDQAN